MCIRDRNNIKYLALGSRNTKSILAYYVSEKHIVDTCSSKMEEELTSLTAEYETMKPSDTIIGNANSFIDSRGYLFFAITDRKYEERHCRTLLNSLRTEFYEKYPLAESGEVKFVDSSFVSDLALKMNDPSKFDKVAEANKKIGAIKEKIQTELKEVVLNQQQMNELDNKANELNVNAKGFEKTSKEFERMMYWRNCKLCLIIALIVIAILAYILVPIIIDQVRKSENSNQNQNTNTNRTVTQFLSLIHI
eukprot:TRINITY_DN2969_c0_g1_i2.p1 TRINITY_DN2969_c0_g1~~TRINITY_DN2969_c0_g1_i2.p1  ORF type:complete len:262 (-),score=50.28 TRINITY_DN2969_c0_g1_i2:34-783(-)